MTDILDPLHPDLLAHWTMGNISASTLIDEAGNHNGAIAGALPVVWDYGDALAFDGSGDRVTITPRVATAQAFTISTFFMISLPSAPQGNWIINSRSAISSSKDEWQIFMYPTGGSALSFWIWNTAGTVFTVDTGITPIAGQTYHAVVTVGAGVIKFYVNNQLINQGTYTGTIRTSSDNTRLGGRSWTTSGADGDLSGRIGVTRIYNGVRSLAEIADLFYEPIPFEVKGTVTQDGTPISTEVRIYDAASGALIGTETSDAGGNYQRILQYNDPVYVMAVPAPGYGPLVHGPVDPALRNTA